MDGSGRRLRVADCAQCAGSCHEIHPPGSGEAGGGQGWTGTTGSERGRERRQHPSDPFCTPLSVAVEQRLNPVEQHVAVQPPS